MGVDGAHRSTSDSSAPSPAATVVTVLGCISPRMPAPEVYAATAEAETFWGRSSMSVTRQYFDGVTFQHDEVACAGQVACEG